MVNENVTIENAQIRFRNFSGTKTEYNKAGNRQFSLFLPDDTSAILEEAGWYVKHKPPRREGDDPRNQLDISVMFGKYPPIIKLISHDGTESFLNEDNVGILDTVDIDNAIVTIRPYNWEVNGKTGTKAYVQELLIYARPPRRALNGGFHQVEEDEEEERF